MKVRRKHRNEQHSLTGELRKSALKTKQWAVLKWEVVQTRVGAEMVSKLSIASYEQFELEFLAL